MKLKYGILVKITQCDISKTRANLGKLKSYSESAPFKTSKNTLTLFAKKYVLTSVIGGVHALFTFEWITYVYAGDSKSYAY